MGAETEVTDDFKLSDRPVGGCFAKNEKSALLFSFIIGTL